MQRNTWKKDRDLMFEAYEQHIIEEGLFSFFKGFSKKLFKRSKEEVEGVDDELIEKLIERLKDGGPEAVKSFLEVLKDEAGVEFEGVVKSNSNKILKALRYGVDSAVDGIANFIYQIVEYAKHDHSKDKEFTRFGSPFTTEFDIDFEKPKFDAETGEKLNTDKFDTKTGERLDSEDEDTKITPQSVLDEIERTLKSAKLNKSFGFNDKFTLMVADKLTELADKLRTSTRGSEL